MVKIKVIILWIFLIILLGFLVFWGYNIYTSGAIFIPLPNDERIFFPLPFGIWYEIEQLDYVNETFKDIEILSDNQEMIDEIKNLLSIEIELENVNKIYYTNQLESCIGVGNFETGIIYISNCNEPRFARDFVLINTNWLPFVLYHEIGHHVLQVRDEDQSLADDFAIEQMIKKNLPEPQKKDR